MQPEERAETGRLVGFGLRGATGVVRDVHGAIADTAFGTVRRYLGPLGRPVVTPVEIAHDTIAGGVYAITGTTLELAGTATGHEVSQTASGKALLRRAGTLRPSVEQPSPGDVGYLLGTSHGKQVWASVEDSILLLGPPR